MIRCSYKTYLLLVIVTINLLHIQCRDHAWKVPKGKCPVTNEIYQKDKSQIVDFMYKNLEYFRQNYDSCCNRNYPEFQIFKSYTERLQEGLGGYKASPIESIKEFIIDIDTIVYSKDGLKCIAFVIFQSNNIELKGWKERNEHGREFDAWGWIGLRDSIDEPLDLYRSDTFGAGGYPNAKIAARLLEELYFTKLKDVHSMSGPFYNLLFYHNVGDSGFFENAPYFQTFHRKDYSGKFYFEDSAIICQVYYSSGCFYKLDFPFKNGCSKFGQGMRHRLDQNSSEHFSSETFWGEKNSK